MRKILSLVLGLLWALPAHADNPCRNLANLNDTTYAAQYWTVDTSTGTISTEQADANFSFWIRNAKAGEQYIMSADVTAVSGGGMQFQVRDSSNQVLSAIGGAGTVGRAVSTAYTIPSDGDYRFNLRTNGSAAFTATDIQIEKGSTATAYTPYDPQCATCNGTIVNYVSATGTGVQNGTPTPTNPIEPTFYKQGNMILRKVGDTYADSYDATTGKITRRVGVKVFDGTENWNKEQFSNGHYRYVISVSDYLKPTTGRTGLLCNYYPLNSAGTAYTSSVYYGVSGFNNSSVWYFYNKDLDNEQFTKDAWKAYLAEQYAAGTPVTVWYPLATEVEEDWPASYCETPIKIATTKYNESAFGPLNTALQNAISVVDTVVSNTITQAGRIATLQSGKQTRPNDIADDNEKCPAGKKCLLVEDASGVPHWYEIVTGRLPDGYTELEYIESTGTQWIDPDINITPTNIATFKSEAVISNVTREGGSISGWSSPSSKLWYGLTSTSPYEFYYSDGHQEKSLNIVSEFRYYKYVIDAPNGSYSVYTESDEAVASKTGLNFSTSNDFKFYLFTYSPTGTASAFKPQKIKYAKFWFDGALVRNLVPALNPDGKIGMYDLVGERFYENAGTGEFIGGQPVFN